MAFLPATRSALALLGISLLGNEVKVTIPETGVELALDIPNYVASETLTDPKRGLLAGKTSQDAVISILHEENFPYTTGRDWYERAWKKKPGAQFFNVGPVACCQWEEKLAEGFSRKQFYAFPTTPDDLFTIHVSGVRQTGGGGATLSRAEFEKIVASFHVTGRADPEKLSLPRAVYEFRDLAAQHERDQLAWVKAQAKATPDAWAVHYYLGVLANYLDDSDPALSSYSRAAELLEARTDRTEKETGALLLALDRAAWMLGSQRHRFREAQPFLTRTLEVTKGVQDERSKKHRAAAFLSLAICHAQLNRPEDAVKSLRSAIEIDPSYRKVAAENELLEPLRKRKGFQELVKP